jgi:hypothetical protein
MTLTEKLSSMTQRLEEEKLSTQKQAEEEKLAPVRNKISELEELRHKLDLIKGSLELKSGDKIDGSVSGEGMKEYSTKTNKKTEGESKKIDSLIEQNKEALQKMGVENKDQLIENSEFAEEVEVVNYKKAKKEGESLEMSDQALLEKLTELGVNIEGEFSYDIAEKAIIEKIKLIDGELSEEKIKTPEGKTYVVEMIAKNLKDSLPVTFFSINEKTQEYKVSISSPNLSNAEDIIIKGDKASFERWYSAGLLPRNIDELEKKYGREIVKSAIKKVYEDKLQKNIKDFDEKNEKNYLLREQLEKNNPEKGMEANNAFKEFSNLQNEFRNTIKEKSDDLKKKGIEFNPTYPSGYGSSYEDLIKLGFDNDVGEIARGINNVSVFPPRFDFEKLKNAIKKRSEILEGLITSVKSVNTEEDVEMFLYGGDHRVVIKGNRPVSIISNFHTSMLRSEIKPYEFDSNFKLEIDRAHNNGRNDNPTQKLISSGFRTFEDAKRYLDQKISLLDGKKNIVLEKINIAIDAKFKQKELEEEITKNNFGRMSNIDFEISRLEQNKRDALDLMSNLSKLEMDLPQEELVFEGGRIIISSVQKEIDGLNKIYNENEEKLKIIKQRNSSHKNKAPTKVWGITTGEGQWKKEQQEKQEQSDLETKIKENSDKILKLYNKLYYNLSTRQYSDVEKLVKENKIIKGKPDEIFKELRVKLNEMINQKVPESIIKLSNEYKDLEAGLK